MSVSAARRDHRSFREYDVVNSIEHRTNLANAGTVHYGRFPHADEVVWRQLLLQVRQGFPQQVTVAGIASFLSISRPSDKWMGSVSRKRDGKRRSSPASFCCRPNFDRSTIFFNKLLTDPEPKTCTVTAKSRFEASTEIIFATGIPRRHANLRPSCQD